ncbi:hypothetical protein Clacol_002579 [Clathrus columnatus]|uniref:Autophagy-related protein n=1 Tax=Clathrus columnatus TaxID=1419009 RepID=A0AAV5A8Y9_9AGAM|nr:hypothetical protein Clacol_002579 [Clathrus columnatus]
MVYQGLSQYRDHLHFHIPEENHSFGPSQFQNLLFLAGYDASQPPFTKQCDANSLCVLVTNGISFAIQAALFLFIGAWADYGRWRPNITIAFTLLAVAVSFAWLGASDPTKWKTGVVLLTFWTAAFPGLARNLPEVEESEKDVQAGTKSQSEHSAFESLQRNRISNVSFTVSSLGEILVLVVMVGILKGLKADQSVVNNTKAFSVLIAFSGGIWLLCALPWFLVEKRRPGLKLPIGVSLLTVGFWQAYVALRECLRLFEYISDGHRDTAK